MFGEESDLAERLHTHIILKPNNNLQDSPI